MKRRLTAYLIALGLLLPAGAARAQGYAAPPPPAPEPARSGFVLGGGLGGGNLGLRGDNAVGEDFGSLFFELHFGGMLSPRAALLVELWGSDHSGEYCEIDVCYPEELRIGQGNAGLALQYWATPRFWLKGGLGTSRLSYRAFGETLETAKGTTVLLGAGFELLHELHYGLDAQLRLTAAGYKGQFLEEYDRAVSVALLLAFSWY